MGRERDRCTTGPDFGIQAGARGVRVTDIGISERQRAGNLVRGRRVRGSGQLGLCVWGTCIGGQHRRRVSEQRDAVGARADILYLADDRLRSRADGADIDEEVAAQAEPGQQQRVGPDAAIIGGQEGNGGVTARVGAAVDGNDGSASVPAPVADPSTLTA